MANTVATTQTPCKNLESVLPNLLIFFKRKQKSGILLSVCHIFVAVVVFLKCLLSIIREQIKINRTVCPCKRA